ncbi:hypothetical protein HYC85_004879 [Camellia sinensis]|uniref:Uncharacterized protein n=1 Tax=Camellia sinensis TaxID=4442 RepID=A0A7J7HZS4_CAMSI|nr:hypothetical protein HYC85_004879 [Camellia sinensis]
MVPGYDINVGLLWHGRRHGISGLHYKETTPLTLSTIYGSERVLSLILNICGVDVNRISVMDYLTALDCYFAYEPTLNEFMTCLKHIMLNARTLGIEVA